MEVVRGVVADRARLITSVRKKSAGRRETMGTDAHRRDAFSLVSGAPAREYAGRRAALKTFAT
jgi:hypothetical protein